MILNRRSERAMAATPVDITVLMSLFEAARWAPSHLNSQNWHFTYSIRGDQYWKQYMNAVVFLNRRWAKDAGALVTVLTRKESLMAIKHSTSSSDQQMNSFVDEVVSMMDMTSNSFEAGAACLALALEGTARGLVVHPIGGFDKEKISKVIGLTTSKSKQKNKNQKTKQKEKNNGQSDDNNDEYVVEIMIVIGNPVVSNDNSETLRVSKRNEIEKFISEGIFKEKL